MKKEKTWLYLGIALLVLVLDQLVKVWVRENIPLHGQQSFLPGLVELTYVQNTGAAFSLFSKHTWILAIISGIAAAAILVLLLKKVLPGAMGRVALALVLGGAIGNLIDRVLLGYVVDMFNLQFMGFAVFNVADIGVTCGGVLLCVYVLFFWKGGSKKQEDKG